MGRYIYCKGDENPVYKYVFAEQDSEMYRIHTEWGLGAHTYMIQDYDPSTKTYTNRGADDSEQPDFDQLILEHSDLEKLKLCCRQATGYFQDMLNAMIEYMSETQQAYYVFESDF